MILVPTSDHPFYLWQVLVQMHANEGQNARWLFYCTSGKPSPLLSAIMDAKIGNVTAWPDWQRDRRYNPAMKSWLVGKYLSAEPTDEPVLIIDPDVILTGRELPEATLSAIIGTDTDSYTGPQWLDSKGALEPLCELVGVPVEQVREHPGVGAQYLVQGVPGAWWERVARSSIKAYHVLRRLRADAQPWCAEMYVTHLSAIRDGYGPTSDERMDMVWANGPASGWETTGFFHDAGVPSPEPGVFCKGTWQNSPFGQDVDVSPETAGYRYLELIRETEERWPDLVRFFDRGSRHGILRA